MKFLLDTCVLSELRRTEANPGLVQWATEADEAWFYVSVATLMEIQKGIPKLADATRTDVLQRWLEGDLSIRFSGRILDVTPETALTWGTLLGQAQRRGARVSVVDALIAATAITHNLTLVTLNASDFEALSVPLLNPWSWV